MVPICSSPPPPSGMLASFPLVRTSTRSDRGMIGCHTRSKQDPAHHCSLRPLCAVCEGSILESRVGDARTFHLRIFSFESSAKILNSATAKVFVSFYQTNGIVQAPAAFFCISLMRLVNGAPENPHANPHFSNQTASVTPNAFCMEVSGLSMD